MTIRIRGVKNAYDQGYHSAGMGYENPYLKMITKGCKNIIVNQKVKAWDQGLKDGKDISNPEFTRTICGVNHD